VPSGSRSDAELKSALSLGAVGYVTIAMLIAVLGGLITDMAPGMLLMFLVYAAFAAFVHELLAVPPLCILVSSRPSPSR